MATVILGGGGWRLDLGLGLELGLGLGFKLLGLLLEALAQCALARVAAEEHEQQHDQPVGAHLVVHMQRTYSTHAVRTQHTCNMQTCSAHAAHIQHAQPLGQTLLRKTPAVDPSNVEGSNTSTTS